MLWWWIGMRFSGCSRVLNNRRSHTKGGEAGWLAVGREAKRAYAGGPKAEGGGHLLLFLSGAFSAPRSGRSSLPRSVAVAPRRPPYTKSFTRRSGDGTNHQTSAATTAALWPPSAL